MIVVSDHFGHDCRIRPWPNDQTLLFKHLQFTRQANCFTVLPRQKTLLVHKTTRTSLFQNVGQQCFGRGQMVKHLLLSQFKMVDQQCLIVWPAGPQTIGDCLIV